MIDTTFHIEIWKKAKILSTDFIRIEVEYNIALQQYLEKQKIQFEQIAKRTIRVNQKDLPFQIIDTLDSYYKYSNQFLKNGNLAILHSPHGNLSWINKITYINNQIDTNFFLFQNHIAFQQFVQLCTQNSTQDTSIRLVDAVNSDARHLTFIRTTQPFRVSISYPQNNPPLDVHNDHSQGLKQLQNALAEPSGTMALFIKSAIIDQASTYQKEQRFIHLFQNLPQIVEMAQINFEVYLTGLSLDSIRSGYEELRLKYFDNLSNLLGKINQKIIALPIGIAATLFALTKIREEAYFIYFMLFAIFTAGLFLSFALHLNLKDLNQTLNRIEKDFQSLAKHSFFKNKKKELEDFLITKNQIKSRIYALRSYLKGYFWSLHISNIILAFIGMKYHGMNPNILVFISLTWFIIVAFFYLLFLHKIINTKD